MNSEKDIIYGLRPVIEAIKAGKEFDKILIQKGLHGDLFRELHHHIRTSEIPFQHVPVEKLNRMINKNHQGVVAFVSTISYQPIEEIITSVFEKGDMPLVLILDGITDVRNFGSIARSAECAGVHAIIIPSQGAAQINADAMKTSAGALNFIPVCRVKNLSQTIDHLKNSGIRLMAATEKAVNLHSETDMNVPLALIMGSEDSGISPAYLRKADEAIKIPILGKIDSLNVSVATAVILFEVVRQRNKS